MHACLFLIQFFLKLAIRGAQNLKGFLAPIMGKRPHSTSAIQGNTVVSKPHGAQNVGFIHEEALNIPTDVNHPMYKISLLWRTTSIFQWYLHEFNLVYIAREDPTVPFVSQYITHMQSFSSIVGARRTF